MKQPFHLSYFIAAFLWCSFCAMAAFVITVAFWSKELESSHGEFKAFFEFWMVRKQEYPVGMVLTIGTGLLAFVMSRCTQRQEKKSTHIDNLTIERWK